MARFHIATLVLSLVACSCSSPANPDEGPSAADPSTPATSANPLKNAERLDDNLAATITERIGAGPYSYHRLRTDDGELHWFVTLGAGNTPGTRVNARVYARKRNFTSKRIRQSFAVLLFGVLSEQP